MSARLLEGNRRFRGRDWPVRGARWRALAAGQQPAAVYIGCADSRVVPNVFLDAEPGELFVVREIAAIVPAPERPAARPLAAALEYAIEQLEVAHVIVCGHDGCGGLAALLESAPPSGSQLGAWLEEAGLDEVEQSRLAALPRIEAVERFVERQLDVLRRYPTVARALAAGGLTLHAWVYDLGNGTVRARGEDGRYRVDPQTDALVPRVGRWPANRVDEEP